MLKYMIFLLAYTAYAVPTPIDSLMLRGNANAGGYAVTNLLAGTNFSQAATYGQLTNLAYSVSTNAVDPVARALAAVALTNYAGPLAATSQSDRLYADLAALQAYSDGQVSLVGSGALWRTEWQQAAGASSEVVQIALTNESSVRAAQDLVLGQHIVTSTQGVAYAAQLSQYLALTGGTLNVGAKLYGDQFHVLGRGLGGSSNDWYVLGASDGRLQLYSLLDTGQIFVPRPPSLGSRTLATTADVSTGTNGCVQKTDPAYLDAVTAVVYSAGLAMGSYVQTGRVVYLGGLDTDLTNGSTGVTLSGTFSGNGVGLTNVPFYIATNWTANTNMTAAAGLAFNPGFGMLSTWTSTNIGGIGIVLVRANGIDTNTVITTYGGTFSGTILATNQSTLAPAQNELVTAQWVRSLIGGYGQAFYATSNTWPSAFDPNVYQFLTTAPAVQFSRTYVAPTNKQYMGWVCTTNKVGYQGGNVVSINAYLSREGGAGGPTLSCHPELYFTYDTNTAKSALFGDYEAAAQTIGTGTNLYQWVIDVPPQSFTGSVYIVRAFKADSVTGGTRPNLTFVGGSNTASHISVGGLNGSAGYVTDAPNDGSVYARKNAGWVSGVLQNNGVSGTDTAGTTVSGGLVTGIGAIPVLTNGNLTIGYSNNMLWFNVPLSSCTGFVFNVGGSNILLKAVN